ncbi:uncharacterized protein TrAFT101_006274 [Trichoderma asperellum]|uniref:uncharacterized protein n=1 Tax=Trichoderma asperellum TaxID=101201 RepID=UPI003321F060|nr:hypothetical protein TrAFT101_006274 [Trichoderma asperellum]
MVLDGVTQTPLASCESHRSSNFVFECGPLSSTLSDSPLNPRPVDSALASIAPYPSVLVPRSCESKHLKSPMLSLLKIIDFYLVCAYVQYVEGAAGWSH